MNIRITEIRNNPPGPDDRTKLNLEYVVIQNFGDSSEKIRGWHLIDRTRSGQARHEYVFPRTLTNGSEYELAPGQKIFVMTGRGEDKFLPGATPGDPEPKPHYHFHQNRGWFVWNNSGDTAYLYDRDANLVSEMSVP